MLLLALALMVMLSRGSPAGSAQATCTFQAGFQTLHDLMPDIVGDCIEPERHDPVSGDGLQQTTGGLLVWRKADNWTAFTDGSTTWINGPSGLAARPNSGPLFPWEGGAAAPVAPAGSSAAAIPSRAFGINISGAEYTKDTRYATSGELDYYIGKGLRVFRLNLNWDLLQPSLNAPLSSSYLAWIHSLVDYCGGRGCRIILDPHAYARYRGQVIGSSDNIGGHPRDGRVGPHDLTATIFQALGHEPATEIHDALGRPLPISRGEMVRQVFSGSA